MEQNDAKTQDEIVYKKPRSRLIRIILAEFMGTALLIFITCTGCTFTKDLSTLQLCFNSGLAVMTVIQIFGHISGAHVNPAVTLCSLIMGETNLIELPFYVIPQIIASIAGYAVVIAVTPREYLADGHCVNMPHYAVSPLQALVVEILATMIMCLAVCSSWDRQNSNRLDSISLRIGCLVVVINMAVGQYTGASMNPVRSLGPAVWNRKLAHHWIYWLGPIIGGSISGFLYKNIFKSHLP